MDLRTEIRALRFVVSARDRSVRLVRETAKPGRLSVGSSVFWFGSYSQGHGNSLPVCVAPAGLLAARAASWNGHRWKPTQVLSGTARAGDRKDSAIRDGGRRRGRDRLCAFARTCADGNDAVQLALQERDFFLRGVFGKGHMASWTGAILSASGKYSIVDDRRPLGPSTGRNHLDSLAIPGT